MSSTKILPKIALDQNAVNTYDFGRNAVQLATRFYSQ